MLPAMNIPLPSSRKIMKFLFYVGIMRSINFGSVMRFKIFLSLSFFLALQMIQFSSSFLSFALFFSPPTTFDLFSRHECVEKTLNSVYSRGKRLLLLRLFLLFVFTFATTETTWASAEDVCFLLLCLLKYY
jgi:hypothetical protein